VQQVYADVLADAGFHVRTATTHDVTVAVVEEEPVDVVTIDIGELGGGIVLATSLSRILIKPLLPTQLVRTVHDVLRDRAH
jgi:DNA-binding response OmpR family regulator